MDLATYFGADFMNCFEGIDFETFLELQPVHIKEAIPELVPRIKFESLYRKFKNELSQINGTCNSEDVISVIELPCSSINSSTSQSNLNVGDKISLKDVTFLTNDDQNLLSVGEQSDQASYEGVLTSQDNLVGATDLNSVTKLNTKEDILAIKSLELRIIIAKYALRKELGNAERVTIGKEIIRYLLENNYERVIKKLQFVTLSELIVEVFPGETAATYFTPSFKKHVAQGKLYSAYTNFKTDLRASGLIGRIRKRKIPRGAVSEEVEESDKEEECLELDIAIENNLRLDSQVLHRYCEATFSKRRKVVLADTTGYLDTFPVFKCANGYEVFIFDADKIHENSTLSLPEISKKIILYAQRQKNSSFETKVLLAEYERELDTLDELSVAGFFNK